MFGNSESDPVSFDVSKLAVGQGLLPLSPADILSQVLFNQCLALLRTLPHGYPVYLPSGEEDDGEDWKGDKGGHLEVCSGEDLGQRETLRAAHSYVLDHITKSREKIDERRKKEEADRATGGGGSVSSGCTKEASSKPFPDIFGGSTGPGFESEN